MGLTKKEAYDILDLPQGAPNSDIVLSYKSLALKWYPQKNKYSALSLEKFKQISHAYKMLTGGSNEQMAMNDMLRLFQEVFFERQVVPSSDDDSYEDYDDDYDDYVIEERPYPVLNGRPALTNAEKLERAMKNAQELIAEEEREKKKTEKRRAKKKRQKLKKKEKEMAQKPKIKNNSNENEESEDKRNKDSSSSDSEEEGIDPNSAFVAAAANKKIGSNHLKKKNDQEECIYLEPVILQSRQLAVRGIEMASVEQYQAAIDLFTEAIKLYPKDFRYFGNRSYCYDRIKQYERALKDSEKSIVLSPQWPKGYFRKGRALSGLKRYSEAETCFEMVINLDKDCKEASQELTMIKMLQLIEMGFSKQRAEFAIREHKTLQAALESLVNGTCPGRALFQHRDESADDEIYQSDEDDFILAAKASRPPSDEKMDPRNPAGLTSLWVGNVKPEVTEKALKTLFSKVGEVLTVRLISEKSCAFVNYKDKKVAGQAMNVLQGKEFYGSQLLIRFPDNPQTVGQPSVTVLRKKVNAVKPEDKPEDKPKIKGPVNGNECFYYRTTGCAYGDRCRYLHIRAHEGIDKR